MADSNSDHSVGQAGALAGAFLGSAVLFIPNILPLVLGYAAKLYDATPLHLGLINSAYAGAAFLATVSAPFWLRLVPWRAVALLGSLLLTVIFAVSGSVAEVGTLIVLFGLAGLAAGAVAAPGNGTIGLSVLPARWFGISSLITLGSAALYAVAGPNLIEPGLGAAGALASLALFFLVCSVAALFIAKRGPSASAGRDAGGLWSAGTRRERAALAASFLALILFAVPAVSYWVFIERIGTGFGLTSRFISITITSGLIAAAVGPLITAALAHRLLTVCLGGVGLALFSYALLLFPGSRWSFFASFVLFNIAWGIMAPGLFSVIRRADFTNRFYLASGAGILVSNTLAGPPAGLIVEVFGYVWLIRLCILVSALLILPLTFALRASRDVAFKPNLAAAAH